MSGNHNTKYETLNVDFKWTVADEAIHRAMNFAKDQEAIYLTLRQEKGMTLHAMLKNAYQEGFLHGFEHKFDQTNYEEK
jgi:hypothetical protein